MSRGLSEQQRVILAHVQSRGSATITELAALTGMRSDSVRRAVQSLECRGLVEHGLFQAWAEAPVLEITRVIRENPGETDKDDGFHT